MLRSLLIFVQGLFSTDISSKESISMNYYAHDTLYFIIAIQKYNIAL